MFVLALKVLPRRAKSQVASRVSRDVTSLYSPPRDVTGLSKNSTYYNGNIGLSGR